MDGVTAQAQERPSGLSEQELLRVVRMLDFSVPVGPASRSGNLERFYRLARFVRAVQLVMDQAFAGTVLADHAIEFGLASCQIELVAQCVYDRRGRSRRHVSAQVSEVILVEALPQTPALQAVRQGALGGSREDLADDVADALEEALEEHAGALYEGFSSDPTDLSDFTLKFDRAKLGGALEGEKPSGYAVFAASCPTEAKEAMAELAVAASAVPGLARSLLCA